MEGWIKLHRCLLQSEVFSSPRLLKIWIWCLCKATHQPHCCLVGCQRVELEEGQFIFGREKAATELDMPQSTVYRLMKLLESMQMLSMKTSNKFSVVTVENWRFYQTSSMESEQQMGSKWAENEQKQEREKQKKIFTPPTVEEVAAYCQERGNNISPEAFIDYYASKGWKVGKNPMKDWRAAVRTWERRQKAEEPPTVERYHFD